MCSKLILYPTPANVTNRCPIQDPECQSHFFTKCERQYLYGPHWRRRERWRGGAGQGGAVVGDPFPLECIPTSKTGGHTLNIVEPPYNKPLYNKVLGITNDFLYPRPSNSKTWKSTSISQNLVIGNKFCQSLGTSLYRGSTLLYITEVSLSSLITVPMQT